MVYDELTIWNGCMFWLPDPEGAIVDRVLDPTDEVIEGIPGELPSGSPVVIDAYPGAQSVSRAVALLKSFSDAQPEWTLGELAHRVGLTKATAHRLLAALESERLVVRNAATGGYRPGPELVALGGIAVRSNDLRTVSRPVLEALASESGETTTLEVLSGSSVVILDEVSSRHMLGMSQDVGARLPVHATSTGKLLLANLDQSEVDAALDGPLQRLTDRTVTSRRQLREQLRTICDDGFAVTDGELEDGFIAVAAPVVDFSGRVVAAISVGGPEGRLTTERLRQVVDQTRAAAAEISHRIGYRSQDNRGLPIGARTASL
jgi:DNA-binding IclR family transcriptional regulator